MTPSKDVSHRRLSLSLRANEDPGLVLQIVYALFALSLFTGLPAIIGMILTLIAGQNLNDDMLLSHYRYQIRTFLIMIVATIIGTILTWFLVGFAILGLTWLWFLYRVLKGWVMLRNGTAMADHGGVM